MLRKCYVLALLELSGGAAVVEVEAAEPSSLAFDRDDVVDGRERAS
jgi:hypothetical protein